jgi:hypothetical protein
MAYVSLRGSEYDLVLRTVEADGTLGEPTVVVLDLPSTLTDPSLAFDGRNLLLAYAAGPDGDEAVLEVRSPLDHALLDTLDLGQATRPRVAVDVETGEAVLLYGRAVPQGTRIRQLFVD